MGPRLENELSNIGLRNVEDTTVIVGIGAVLKSQAQSPGIVAGSIEGLCAAIPGSLINLRGISFLPILYLSQLLTLRTDMDHSFSLENLETLEERLRKELADQGGYIRYRVTWGQK